MQHRYEPKEDFISHQGMGELNITHKNILFYFLFFTQQHILHIIVSVDFNRNQTIHFVNKDR